MAPESGSEAPALGARVSLERLKWPEAPHYVITGTILGQDEHGTWVGSPAGSPLRLPDGREAVAQQAAVFCVPEDDWFLLHYWHHHPEVDLYVDICTPPVWVGHSARMVDLDLDVVRWNQTKGGSVEVVDEDEFEEHRVALEYPDDLVVAARLAATDVLGRVEAEKLPFRTDLARQWLQRL